jgi:hypothetical protein
MSEDKDIAAVISVPEDYLPITGIYATPAKTGELPNITIAGTVTLPFPESLGFYIDAAKEAGYAVPDKLSINAGQLFWKDGKIEEVRLSGGVAKGEPDTDGKDTIWWNTPTPPRFIRGQQGELVLAPEDVGRTHMSVLFVKDSEATGGGILVITLDVTENYRIVQALIAKKEPVGNLSEPLKSDSFNVHTGQEWTSLINLASDGKSGRNFTANDQRGALRHKRPGSTFFTEFVLLDEEREAGHGMELLWQAIHSLDVDDGIAWLYVSHLLSPPGPLPPYASATAWIDLDDVARKAMAGYAPNPDEIVKRREKVYHAIRCGARAHISGKRSITYIEKQTGRVIDTEIYTSPWQIVSREEPTQPTLWPCDSVPVRVELVASREWTALTTNPETMQFLPFGEVLGSIPGNQPSGAWARALGLAYLNWCRWHLHEALRGEVPTRGQMLDQHPAKKAPYQEILDGKDPGRALTYFQGAEKHLKEKGLIEIPSKRPIQAVDGKGWKKQWLNTPPPWKLGPVLKPIIEDLAQNRFQSKPRELNPAKRRPGRPRKQVSRSVSEA